MEGASRKGRAFLFAIDQVAIDMQEIPVRSFAVSVVVLREVEKRTEVLLLKRTRTLAGEWCQIVGGIEVGETA